MRGVEAVFVTVPELYYLPVGNIWEVHAMPTIAPTLQPFADGKYARLTTYRRDGTGSGTPVTIAVEDGRAFVRTWDTTLKARRMRRNPVVEIAPCTARGTS